MSADVQYESIEDELRRRLAEPGGELLGQGYQAVVRRYTSPLGELVVKSPHRSSLLAFVGRMAIRHEWRAYRRLNGIPGIPRAFGLLDDEHLVLEAIAGPPLRAYESRLRNRERFFAQLLETLDAMHAAGVAHGDLKRKDNIIVGPQERPYLIDFGIASIDGEARRRWRRKKFEWVRQLDYNAWIKLKHGREPTALPAEDAALYRPLLLERLARAVRVPWQRLTLRRPRQRWRQRRQQQRDRSAE